MKSSIDRHDTASSRFRSLAILAFGAALGALPATGQGSVNPPPGSLPGVHPVAPLADGQWTMPAGDYGNLRYSPLDKINTQNVQNLHLVATQETGIPHGHEGQPLVVNGTLYMVYAVPQSAHCAGHYKAWLSAEVGLQPSP